MSKKQGIGRRIFALLVAMMLLDSVSCIYAEETSVTEDIEESSAVTEEEDSDIDDFLSCGQRYLGYSCD